MNKFTTGTIWAIGVIFATIPVAVAHAPVKKINPAQIIEAACFIDDSSWFDRDVTIRASDKCRNAIEYGKYIEMKRQNDLLEGSSNKVEQNEDF